jgi:glycosyltransferase involved in cell wall biosynthesis
MRVKIEQFLYQNHSWSIVGWNIARSLIEKGHDVNLIPTDTDKKCYLPNDLKPYIKNKNGSYDMQISYTALHNFSTYLSSGNKRRFGIWCYEFKHGLPSNMIKHHNFCDKILAPSEFAKEVFVDGKIPEEKIEVIPHGINLKDYENKEKFKLKTDKKFKILVNVAQCHLRKNIPAVFEAYGKAFNNKDDVCLLMKVIPKREGKENAFDVNFYEIYKEFCKKYKEHAEVEIITDFIENLVSLYNTCNIVFTMSYGEGFYLPGLEAIAANKINIAPNYGGQKDFLYNNINSLLIDGKIVRAEKKMLYWEFSPYASMFQPNIDNAAELLYKCYKEYDNLLKLFTPSIKYIQNKYTWKNTVDQIINLNDKK